MSVAYIESYKVNGVHCGIEDYEDGRSDDQHFMPDRPHSRFKLWYGGSSIGETRTLRKARKKLQDFLRNRLLSERDELTRKLSNVVIELENLSRKIKAI